MRILSLIPVAALTLTACRTLSEDTTPATIKDTGWLSSAARELEGRLVSRVAHAPTGEWQDLATDVRLQEKLVDLQIKYGKNRLARDGFHLNQLHDKVTIKTVGSQDGLVMIDYEAVVDVLRKHDGPDTLESVEPRAWGELKLPLDPLELTEQAGQDCVAEHADHEPSDYNYYYYFDADRESCKIPVHKAALTLERLFPRTQAWPEYDRLLNDLGDGRQGFKAAIIPDVGDSDAGERFARHRRELEKVLALKGQLAEDNTHWTYRLERGEAAIEIALYDPRQISLEKAFKAGLGGYQLVFFNGHSIYGTRDVLLDPADYLRKYQMVFMHSCRSYEYYARQVLRAKATPADPRGWDMADLVVTGEPSYPTDSPDAMRIVLVSLLTGLNAVISGHRDEAPDWLAIARQINTEIGAGITYGAAGVRENHWRP